MIFGLISMVACTYVLSGFTFLKKRPSLKDPSAMIFFLVSSDFFLSLDYFLEGLLPLVYSKYCNLRFCYLKAFTSQFFTMSSFFWTAAISHSSYCTVKHLFIQWSQASGTSGSKWLEIFKYHAICWIIPLVCSLGMNLGGQSVSKSCSILNVYLWMTVLLYMMPLLLVESFNIFVFAYIARVLTHIPNEIAGDEILKRFSR